MERALASSVPVSIGFAPHTFSRSELAKWFRNLLYVNQMAGISSVVISTELSMNTYSPLISILKPHHGEGQIRPGSSMTDPTV